MAEPTPVGSGFHDAQTFSVVEALRRDRPRTAQGYVHVGPALLEEAATRLEGAEEELTMIALALKNQGIGGDLGEQVTPERGVEILIERLAEVTT